MWTDTMTYALCTGIGSVGGGGGGVMMMYILSSHHVLTTSQVQAPVKVAVMKC